MKRKQRKNATEISVFVVQRIEDGSFAVVDPSMEGDSISLGLFKAILDGLVDSVNKYNKDRPDQTGSNQ